MSTLFGFTQEDIQKYIGHPTDVDQRISSEFSYVDIITDKVCDAVESLLDSFIGETIQMTLVDLCDRTFANLTRKYTFEDLITMPQEVLSKHVRKIIQEYFADHQRLNEITCFLNNYKKEDDWHTYYGAFQILAHQFAYSKTIIEMETSVSLPINESSSARAVFVVDKVFENNYGLKVVALKCPDNEQAPPILVFQGTDQRNKFHMLTNTDLHLGRRCIEQSEDLLDQIDNWLAQQNKKAILTGHSLGGMLCQRVAARYVDRVQKVITYNSPGGLEDTIIADFEVERNPDLQVMHFHTARDPIALHNRGKKLVGKHIRIAREKKYGLREAHSVCSLSELDTHTQENDVELNRIITWLTNFVLLILKAFRSQWEQEHQKHVQRISFIPLRTFSQEITPLA